MSADNDCQTIRETLAAGGDLSPALLAHRAGCRLCQAVDAAAEVGPAGDLDSLFAQIDTEVAAETGALARLRERPGPERIALGLLAIGLTTVLVWLTTRRVDLAVYPLGRLVLEMSGLTVAAALAIWLGLRPLHRADPDRSTLLGVLGLFAALPFLSGLLPEAHHDHPASLVGAGSDLARRALQCFTFGMASAIPTLGALFALQRVRRPGAERALQLAVAGGMTGLLALAVHCPITRTEHLTAGHAPVVLGAMLAVAVGWLVIRRLRPRDAH